METPLIEAKNLKVYFPVSAGLFGRGGGVIKAVDDVSFTISQGETLGLVGESGSGKTTIGRALLRLLQTTSGEIFFKGEPIHALQQNEFRKFRKQIQIIFQDPYNSLNPRLTVISIIGEALEIHFPRMTAADRRDRVAELLKKVGLSPDHMSRYPHEFSGGQRQRIGIARALAVEPEFIVCDEPVSALDVSVQAQIINLLQDLQEEMGLTYLFIGHDLAVVEHISDRVMVMCHGKIVESASSEELYASPQHPYTRQLLDSVPHI